LDLSRRRRRSETSKAMRGKGSGREVLGKEFTHSPADYRVWGSVASSPARSGAAHMILSHYNYIRNFVRFRACCSAFWNLTGNANKTDSIRPHHSAAIVLEGARGHVPPVSPSGSAPAYSPSFCRSKVCISAICTVTYNVSKKLCKIILSELHLS